ncbi:MAG: hypothetical protein ABIO46_15895 [Chitinophagales bacterium]
MLKTKFISPSGFGAVIICFILPFLNLKCNEVNLATVKGVELVSGSRLKLQRNLDLPSIGKDESKQLDLEMEDQNIDRNYFAVAALLLAIGGLVLSFLLFLQKEMIMSTIGLGGGLALLLMRIQIDSSIEKQTHGVSNYIIHIDYVYGYWLAIVFFLVVGVYNMSQHIDNLQKKAGRMDDESVDSR